MHETHTHKLNDFPSFFSPREKKEIDFDTRTRRES